jgi:FkbM family methyltransferase
MPWLTTSLAGVLARRGLVIQRHPAWRRQGLLRDRGVDVVVDIGAARGGFAQELRGFGYTGKIVSFEPLSSAYSDLAATASGDPLWTTVNAALGEEAGRLPIHIASNSDSSSLLPLGEEHRAAAPHIDYLGIEHVDVVRLDDVASEHIPSGARTFLKLDAQGYERQVLAGGPRTLASSVGVQLELSLAPLYDGGMLVDEAVCFLYEEGFRLMAIFQGFTTPRGEMVQADGVFFREGSSTA